MDDSTANRQPPARRARTIVIGAVSFMVASLVVRADPGPNAIPPGHINAISDASDQTLTVHVNAAGELSASDSGTRNRLDLLYYKLLPLGFVDGGLKVSAQGHVSVDNLPQTQEVTGSVTVAGTVTIANMPSQQTVSGTVNVGNFPATQPISGTVTIANLPATQSIEPTTASFGAAQFHLLNDGTIETAYLAGQSSPRFRELFPPNSPHLVTLIALNADRDVHLTCLFNGVKLFVLANSSVNQRQEFVHPLQVDRCFIECLHTLPDLPFQQPYCNGNYSVAGIGPAPSAATGGSGGFFGGDPCVGGDPLACP